MTRKYESTKENIERYIEKAKKRIVSAESLLEKQQYNDAISRAYYAFFDGASAALLSKNLFVKTHHGLGVLFSKHFIDTGEFPISVGRWLNKAREAREEADYDLWKEYNKEQAEAAIKAAKEFVKNIEKIFKR